MIRWVRERLYGWLVPSPPERRPYDQDDDEYTPMVANALRRASDALVEEAERFLRETAHE
jgi:hypothetical protein